MSHPDPVDEFLSRLAGREKPCKAEREALKNAAENALAALEDWSELSRELERTFKEGDHKVGMMLQQSGNEVGAYSLIGHPEMGASLATATALIDDLPKLNDVIHKMNRLVEEEGAAHQTYLDACRLEQQRARELGNRVFGTDTLPDDWVTQPRPKKNKKNRITFTPLRIVSRRY